jgi:phosphate-selective porin OprO/OprP
MKPKQKSKLNRILPAILLGAPAVFSFLIAAHGETTNSVDAAAVQVPANEATVADTNSAAVSPAEAAEIETLKGQVEDLDQKIRILDRHRELDKDDATAAAKTQPILKLDASGFTFSSADTNFAISLHGLIQLDSRTFFSDHNLINNAFLLRRARPIISGTVFHDYDFNFTPDFGGNNGAQILDAYINYRNRPELQVEAGKFKSPVGLEALQSDPYCSFNERSLVTDLVPNRDLGVELHGDLFGGAISYAAGIFNGVSDYNGATVNTDADNDKAFAGRIFLQPWKTTGVNALKGLGAGVGGSFESDRNLAAGVVANGQHWRVSPQGYYYFGPLGILGEYVISDQEVSRTVAPLGIADLRNTAWEISAGWVLTGEDASYTGVTPRHPFDPRTGHWGAWQVVGRFEELNVDRNAFSATLPFALSTASASSARAWAVGLNWYLNRNIRLNTSFSRTLFSGYNGATPAVPAQAENVLFTRIQLAF